MLQMGDNALGGWPYSDFEMKTEIKVYGFVSTVQVMILLSWIETSYLFLNFSYIVQKTENVV